MKKQIVWCRALLGLAGICAIVGFFFGASSTNNIAVTMTMTIIGCMLAASAIVPAVKLIQLQNKQKEENKES